MSKVDDAMQAALAAVIEDEPEAVEEKRGHPILKGLGFLMLLGMIAAAAAAIVQRGRSDDDWNAV